MKHLACNGDVCNKTAQARSFRASLSHWRTDVFTFNRAISHLQMSKADWSQSVTRRTDIHRSTDNVTVKIVARQHNISQFWSKNGTRCTTLIHLDERTWIYPITNGCWVALRGQCCGFWSLTNSWQTSSCRRFVIEIIQSSHIWGNYTKQPSLNLQETSFMNGTDCIL